MPDNVLLDRDVFEAARKIMDQKFTRIIGYYLEDTASYIETIKSGMTHHDAAIIMPAAHTIKSSSKQMGAEYLSSIAAKLEQMSREHIKQEQNFSEIANTALLLEKIFISTKQEIEDQI